MKQSVPLCALMFTLGVAPLRAAPTERFAVVVGNNLAPREDLAALHYADDDAARLHELFTAAGMHSVLLTVMDEETQGLMPGLASQALPPTRQQLLSVLQDTDALMERAHARGSLVEFTFAFAGHGMGSAEGGASIYLLDGPFTRADLMEFVVKASPADFNHVLVDACDSYFMVAQRGAGEGGYANDRVDAPQAEDLIRQYLVGDGPMQDVRTGFVVSTNQAAQSHEYEGFHSGVFSHVVHSALTGAADANRDGRVEYSEVLAYAAAASQEIRDPRARLTVYGRPPPRDVHRPLMDLTDARFSHYLRLGPDVHGRLHVEDDRTIRYADLNKPAGTEMLLALVDQTTYRVVREDGNVAVVPLRMDRRGAVRVGAFSPLGTTARGDLGVTLRKELFSIPFDQSFYRGFVASQRLSPASVQGAFNPPDAARRSFLPERPRLLFGVPGIFMLAGGGVLGLAAGGLTVATMVVLNQYAQNIRNTGVADPAQETRINALRIGAALAVAAGLAALAVGGVLVAVELLWPVHPQEAP